MLNTFSPVFSSLDAFRSRVAIRRTSSWSIPSSGGDVRRARARSYCATSRLARSRSASRIDRLTASSSSTGGAGPAGRPARPPPPGVELEGEGGDPAGRDVGGDVDLAAPDDAQVDDAP